MQFSLFSFNPFEKKKNQPQEVICTRKISGWEITYKILVAFAALAVSVCAIAGTFLAAKSYRLVVQNLNCSVQTGDFLTRPVPVIEIVKDGDLRIAVVNRGERPLRAVKTSFKILYENGGIQKETGGTNYQETLGKDRAGAFSIGAAYTGFLGSIDNPSQGYLFIIVVLSSPSVREHTVKILYRNLADPEHWLETDSSLSSLGPDHRRILSEQIEGIARKTEKPDFLYSV